MAGGDARPLRSIGVVYDPEDEQNEYVPVFLSRRYDLFVFEDTTRALQPLRAPEVMTLRPLRKAAGG